MVREDFERHYDNLLWTVTTIFAAAIGGLFVYVHSKPDYWLSIFGLIVTGLTIYLATSFRQLRHFYSNKKNSLNHLPQWPVYIFIFWGLGLLWTNIIANTCSEFWCIFIAVASVWTLYAVVMCIRFYKT